MFVAALWTKLEAAECVLRHQCEVTQIKDNSSECQCATWTIKLPLHLSVPILHDQCSKPGGPCYTSDSCLQTFYHNLFTPFPQFLTKFFFLFRFTGEEYLNTQGIQVMPVDMEELLQKALIPNMHLKLHFLKKPSKLSNVTAYTQYKKI